MEMIRRVFAGVAVVVALWPAQAGAAARFFGFNDNAPLTHDLTVDQDARLLAKSGANSARITLDWTWVEQSEGTLNLSLYDPIYHAWLSRGIRPVFIITGSPQWAWPPWWTWPDLNYCFSGGPCHVAPDPSKDGEWAHFAAAVAARYPRAAAIEVWNEPNLRTFFATGPDPVRYTQLLRLAYTAIKRVNPSMTVLGGSLASVFGDERSTDAWSAMPFLNAIYANGAAGLMDGLSIHAYPHDHGAADVLGTVNDARQATGGKMPLWVTEVGASTTGGWTDASQAALLRLTVAGLMRAADVVAVYVHTLIDPQAIPASDPEHGYGVLRSATDPKPAFCNLRQIFMSAARARKLPRCANAAAR